MRISDWSSDVCSSDLVREGSDVTVVSVSRMVHEALAAAEQLAADDGTSVEVIDLRTVAPLDTAPILESVAKTGRLLAAPQGVTPFGKDRKVGVGGTQVEEREALGGRRRSNK